MPDHTLGRRAALALGTAALAAPALAQPTTDLKMVLDWAIQGPNALFVHALDRGYYRDEGITMTVDRGNGSADAVTKLASGSYDLAFGDLNAMVQFNAAQPSRPLIGIFMMHDRPQLSVMTLDPAVRALPDLEGRRVTVNQGTATWKLFPGLARRAGVNPDRVNWVNASNDLVDTLVFRGQAEASLDFYATGLLNYRALGAPPDRIRAFFYADYGLDIYGNGVLTSRALATAKPDAMRGVCRAVSRAMRDMLTDPDAIVAAARRRDTLTDPAIERARLAAIVDVSVRTPGVREHGFGDVDDARLTRALAQLAEAYGLPAAPPPSDVFDRSFLPPASERMLP